MYFDSCKAPVCCVLVFVCCLLIVCCFHVIEVLLLRYYGYLIHPDYKDDFSLYVVVCLGGGWDYLLWSFFSLSLYWPSLCVLIFCTNSFPSFCGFKRAPCCHGNISGTHCSITVSYTSRTMLSWPSPTCAKIQPTLPDIFDGSYRELKMQSDDVTSACDGSDGHNRFCIAAASVNNFEVHWKFFFFFFDGSAFSKCILHTSDCGSDSWLWIICQRGWTLETREDLSILLCGTILYCHGDCRSIEIVKRNWWCKQEQ